jgi:pilus assembly protein CpaC
MRHVGRLFLGFIFLVVIVDRSVIYADDSVRLMVGRSTVVTMASPIARVSLTSADVADALVTSPTELLINGKTPGTISMFVWDRSGAIQKFEVIVQRDLARLSEQLKRSFPAESIDVQANGRAVLLSGTVTSKDVIERAADLAAGYVDKKEEVVSLLRLQEGAPTNQVLLRVRFAEVSRSALTELGASFFTSPTGVKNTIARVTTQQFPAPGYDAITYTKADGSFGSPVSSATGQFNFSDFLNFFLFSEKYDIGTMIRALQTRGLFESLAEPNLVSESGKEASFLAGGEFPVPIAQGGTNGLAISVVFKEFGIRLTFTPVVVGNRVHLKVRPEVSTLDFTNAITLNGFRIPALSTRRTETELELNNGQTFAIAGLLNNTMNKTMQKVPGIGDIPILGLLFKSQAAQKERTELVVMITPEILRTNAPGVTRELPRLEEPFLPGTEPKKTMPMPPPAFPSASTVAPSPAQPVQASSDAASAAGKVKALMPSTTPSVVHAETMPKGNDASRKANDTTLKANETTPRAAETPAAAVVRPLTEKESKTVARSRKVEHDQSEAAKASDAKARAKQLEEERKQQEKAAREQAKQDAEAAKTAAEAGKRQAAADRVAEEAAVKLAAAEARKQAEVDKKQAEIDKKNQKVVADAEARLKAAQAAYDAETAKTKKPQ